MDKLTSSNNNALSFLKAYTQARVDVGITGASIPTRSTLRFNLAHANARDAVYSSIDAEWMQGCIAQMGHSVLYLNSQANTRMQYLQRPDLGRRLHPESLKTLVETKPGTDVCIIITDGLSAHAVHQNAIHLLGEFLPLLRDNNLTVSPICLVKNGRVAIGDDIGYNLKAKLTIMLIGERPGLSACNSLGIYITYQPKPGLTDDLRNCISNVRPGGLSYTHAARKLSYLVTEAFNRKLTGVELKEESAEPVQMKQA